VGDKKDRAEAAADPKAGSKGEPKEWSPLNWFMEWANRLWIGAEVN
jgi:hypothetical protein